MGIKPQKHKDHIHLDFIAPMGVGGGGSNLFSRRSSNIVVAVVVVPVKMIRVVAKLVI